MSITFTMEGLDQLTRRLTKSGKLSPQAMAGPLKLEAELIMTKAKNLTPVDLGTLRASGHVKRPVITRNAAKVLLGFGGAASAYALAVHEHPSSHSPPSWQGGVSFTSGGPKYLERPVKEARKGFGRRVARHLDLF